jgi:hypothetical protein
VLDVMRRAIDTDDLGEIVESVRYCSSPVVAEYVLLRAKASLDAMLGKPDAKDKPAIAIKLLRLLVCLEGRTDAEAEGFLIKCFDFREKLAGVKGTPSGKDVNGLVARMMSEGSPTLQGKLISHRAMLLPEQLFAALFAARVSMSPAVFFDTFNADLTNRTNAGKGEYPSRRDAVAYAITSKTGPYVHIPYVPYVERQQLERPQRDLPPLDPRWLDAAIVSGEIELVAKLARPGHPGLEVFLTERFTATKDARDVKPILAMMVMINHVDAAESIISTYSREAKRSASTSDGQYYGYLISELPKSQLSAIEAAMAKLSVDIAEPIRDGLRSLKWKSD